MAEGGQPARAVMVTAAWSPVGRAAAARLAQRGDLVLMGARRPDHCERLASRLRGQGATAFAGYLDLADTVSIDRFVESARYLIGEVDVLITDAGLCAAEAHVVGAQHLAAQLIPPMIRHGHGDVVLVSPDLVAGTKPPRTAVSAASRQALDVWVSGLDAEFVGTGVRASLVRSAWPGSRVAPDDVACVIAAMLASDERMHLRLVEVISHRPAAAPAKGREVR
ncbi:SDR family NAD(P)-dependent oxidoreductase [Mycobacterium xenopi]|nr:SDR family NAD(P)-dependent oxidoreductase [Mycobacterium xenopi]MDA3640429.1 SDR family NAD(P)-dependent oxidoreductase [Mycobacterium xenopi]MDA3656588.1 SDR family NAD(P)-dependent oxidoreductase [Mycobacterium xenopi]MDA3661183.1 SDR family NAD(P)-dependent oxidoreductase [Mycobacterium xenopi]